MSLYDGASDWCSGHQVWTAFTVTTYCDGSILLSPANNPATGVCHLDDCYGNGTHVKWGKWQSNYPCGNQQTDNCCQTTPPAMTPQTTWCNHCPIPPTSCPKGDGGSSGGNPITLPQSEQQYTIRLFPLDQGFPDFFSLIWRGRRTAPLSNGADPLGSRMMHSFSLFLSKTSDGYARVSTEDGAIEAFQWNGSAWAPEDARVSLLEAAAPGAPSCTSLAKMVLDDGTTYYLNDTCTGTSPTEGVIQQIVRPNGETLNFVVSTAGLVTEVSNRRNATVSLSYSGTQLDVTAATWGVLDSITAPDQKVYSFQESNGVLAYVFGPDGTVLYHIVSDPASQALLSIRDGNGTILNSWAYDPNVSSSGTGGVLPLTESGPGSGLSNTLTLGALTSGHTIAFTSADTLNPSQTNYYYWLTNGAALAHVTSRTLNGAFPNSGPSSPQRQFWTNRNEVEWTKDENGFYTVNEDLSHLGDPSFAYDQRGNPLVEYTGCDSPTSCSSGKRVTYSYQYQSSVPAMVGRPSVVSGVNPIVETRAFEGTSTRITLDVQQGYTASTLSGSLDSTPTCRTTKFVYGGGAAGLDLTEVDGPFWDSTCNTSSPTVPSDAPKTTYTYYSGENDVCSQSPVPTNLYRLKSVTHYIDASRTLATSYCSYDGGGLPGKVQESDGTFTITTYDARGNVTEIARDVSGLNLVTDYAYDLAGNLIDVALPLLSATTTRVGYTLSYDSAGRLTDIYRGHFGNCTPPSNCSLTILESAHLTLDQWGNRTRTQLRDSGGSTIFDLGAQFDAFGRVKEVDRPYGSTNHVRKFSYDSNNNLIKVAGEDSQNDYVYYGKAGQTITSYDRFDLITELQQKICNHPTSSPNGSCNDSGPHKIDFAYDIAQQLSQISIYDQVRGGGAATSTSYTRDDFGQLVKVVSPDSGATTFTYNGAGGVASSEDARGKTFAYTYDRTGRLTVKHDSSTGGQPDIDFCYDGQDAACGGTNSSRSAARLTFVKDGANSFSKVKLTYDSAGRLTREDRTLSSGAVFTQTWSRDALGHPLINVLPSQITVFYTWDANGNLSNVSSSGPATLSGFAYFPFLGASAWQMNSTNTLKMQILRDSGGRITQTFLAKGGFLQDQLVYAYADSGNVDSITDLHGGTSGNVGHDSLNRLTTESDTTAYTWDDAGNRTTSGATGYTYWSATGDKLKTSGSSTWNYDADGNVTSRNTDITAIGYLDDGSVGSMQTGSGTTSYVRDYRGLRLEVAGAAGGATYTYDESGRLSEWRGQLSACSYNALRNDATKTQPLETIVYVGDRPAEMLKSHFKYDYGTSQTCRSSPSVSLIVDETYAYWTDLVGMPRALYRRSSEVRDWSGPFSAFGSPRSPGIVNSVSAGGYGCGAGCSIRLPGQLALTTQEAGPSNSAGGLHENWHRIYDSVTGRYLEPDSMTLGVESVPSPYAYVFDAPLRHTDRKGRFCDVEEGPFVLLDPDCQQDIVNLGEDIGELVGLGGAQPGPQPKPQPLPNPTPSPAAGPEPQPSPAPTPGPGAGGGGGGASCPFNPPGKPPKPEDCSKPEFSINVNHCSDCCAANFGPKHGGTSDDSIACYTACRNNNNNLPGGPRPWHWP